MLFNSPEFILLFLPIAFLGFFWIGKSSHRLAALWLGVASLFFYGWWNPKFVSLLLASISFNYAMGYVLGRQHTRGGQSKLTLAFAVAINLLVLGIFKYTNFFISTVNELTALNLPLTDILLPLGISFYTFTQIAFLVDVYRGLAREYNFIHYILFVTYFPHLIAGPVLHHKQMMPQFAAPETYRIHSDNVVSGLAIFIIGLAKKVVLADSLAMYAKPVFAAADQGGVITFFDGWGGALAYTFQLYFDFSGYSDMAIGLSLMFGIKLPINFNSPYKSPNMIEFWRRWHMTLSQFLRDYLYIALGGNRNGKVRRHINLLLTMLLGGLWHGANWTFVAWGGLHGGYLVINHLWRSAIGRHAPALQNRFFSMLGVLLTFVCVVVAWVFFRAETFQGALAILHGMAGRNGLLLPDQIVALIPGLARYVTAQGSMELLGNGAVMGVFEQACLIGLGFVICWCFPNTQSMSPRAKFIAIVLSFAFVVQGVFFSQAPSEFLYFRF